MTFAMDKNQIFDSSCGAEVDYPMDSCGASIANWFCFEFQLLLLLFLPGLLNVYLGLDSLRAGLLAGLLCYATCCLARTGHGKRSVDLRYLFLVFLFLIIVILQFAVVSEVFAGSDSVRFFLSLSLILFILMLVPLFYSDLVLVGEERLILLCRLVFWILSMSGCVASVLYLAGMNPSKGLILFKEPSHFALMYLPFLLYISYISRGLGRFFYPLVGFFIAFSVQNLTLVVGLLLLVFILADLKRLMAMGSLLLVVLLLVSNVQDYLGYYLDRLDFSGNSQNLSVLVYLSGFERAYLSVVESFGGGVGFQQMGIVGPEGNVMERIVQIVGVKLNHNDGGFLASKVVTEFGAVGLFFIFVFACVFVRSLFLLKFAERMGQVRIFLSCVFVMFAVELFVRGTGYFTPTIFMFLVSLYAFFFAYSREESVLHELTRE